MSKKDKKQKPRTYVEYGTPINASMPLVMEAYAPVIKAQLDAQQAFFDAMYRAKPTPWTLPLGGGFDELSDRLAYLHSKDLPDPPLIKVHLSDARRMNAERFKDDEYVDVKALEVKIGTGNTVMGIDCEVIPDPITEDERRTNLMLEHRAELPLPDGTPICICGTTYTDWWLHLYDVIAADAIANHDCDY